MKNWVFWKFDYLIESWHVMNNFETDYQKGIDISKSAVEKYALENYGVKPKTSFERMAVAQDKVFRTIHEKYIKTQKK